MEAKLDQLLASMDELKKAQESDKVEMVERLDQLEQDVATNQDVSTAYGQKDKEGLWL